MKKKIQAVFDKYLFSNKNIDLNQKTENVIDHVENELAEQKQNVKNCLLFHTELLELKRIEDLEKLNNDNNFKKIRKDLISCLYFKEDDEKFIYDKKIEINSVKFLTEESISQILLLNQNQKKIIEKEGFEIFQIIIPKFKKFKCIYCKGKHSNINPKTNEYCLGSSLFNADLNYDNVWCLLKSMQCLTLYDNYLEYDINRNLLNMIY